jgi:RNA polymerase sigma factor (sigma-70 family)
MSVRWRHREHDACYWPYKRQKNAAFDVSSGACSARFPPCLILRRMDWSCQKPEQQGWGARRRRHRGVAQSRPAAHKKTPGQAAEASVCPMNARSCSSRTGDERGRRKTGRRLSGAGIASTGSPPSPVARCFNHAGLRLYGLRFASILKKSWTLASAAGRLSLSYKNRVVSSHLSNPALIQACRRGEQDAWNVLVAQYGRLVFSIPRRYGFPEADSEDIMQATFAALVRSLATLKDDTRLSAWLITTAHRECWRLRRRIAREERAKTLLEHPDSPPVEDAARWEQQHLVRLALERLGGRCERLLVALFQARGKPAYEDIARELGMKVGSIGPTRARCFAKMEKILREMGFEPEKAPVGCQASAVGCAGSAESRLPRTESPRET